MSNRHPLNYLPKTYLLDGLLRIVISFAHITAPMPPTITISMNSLYFFRFLRRDCCAIRLQTITPTIIIMPYDGMRIDPA